MNACSWLIPGLLLPAALLLLYDIGFNPFETNNPVINYWVLVLLRWVTFGMCLRWVLSLGEPQRKRSRILSLLVWMLVAYFYLILLPNKMLSTHFDSNNYLLIKSVLYGGIFMVFIMEASLVFQFIYKKATNPAFLFVISFLLLVLLGALLLMLPNATVRGLRLTDALFMATSTVCVTGLTVVDIAREFTGFGQVILLLLIQAGGLGIMTFTGILSHALAGSISLRNELAFRDLFRGSRIGSVIRLVYRIVLVTFLFEALGAVGIYLSLDSSLFERDLDKWFFSIFHAVSAFCNAGISTLPNGLHEEAFRFNYSFQLLLTLLIILGGLGFAILFNLYSYMEIRLTNAWWRLRGLGKRTYIPRLININSRLALVTTSILLVAGFLAYWAFERAGTLQQHPGLWGKLVTCLFGAVTPRSAGFNTVDLTGLTLPMIMVYLLLMWIGASPGSTGGGIKTTTFGVAVLNMVSVIRGRDRVEFYRSEISQRSVRRSFTIILLSFLFMGIAVFLLSIQDGDKGLVQIAFEAFSAYSTVGLTLGITHELSDLSRMVLVFTMFIGRVGALTLLMAFVRQSRQLYYRYPQEEIFY